MRVKPSTLMRSESQSEKGLGSVRVGGDANLSPAPRRTRHPGLRSELIHRFLLEHAYVQAPLKL